MAISRPLLIALVAAIVALGAFYATQGSRQASDAPSAAAPEPATQPERHVAKTSTPEPPAAKTAKAHAATTGPAAVERAIQARKTVVLLFQGPDSADDTATSRAVATLDGKPGVAIFKAPITRLTAYRKLIGELGIAQAPAVVIVGRKRAARVIEGYVDPPTLAQDVADAR